MLNLGLFFGGSMKKLIDLISEELRAAFAECGYEERFGNASVSNRPDLCQYQCNGAMAAAKQYKKAPIIFGASAFMASA